MKALFTILISFFYISSFSQNQGVNWFFGEGAGINFDLTSNSVYTINGGQTTNQPTATISDKNGNLLFYTSGLIIYNKNHEIMPNATNELSNDFWQILIVPQPKNPDLFFVFAVSVYTNSVPISYSIVDMTKDGGLGDVIEKRITIPVFGNSITAFLKDCVNKSVWIVTSSGNVTNNSTTFYAFELTSDGLNTTPIESTFPFLEFNYVTKISQDGKRLVTSSNYSLEFGISLYDFDSNTGIVSNKQNLSITLYDYSGTLGIPFVSGLEFSPSNNLLYANSTNARFYANQNERDDPSLRVNVLTQFNLLASDIQSTETVIDQRNGWSNSLQIGPDDKIYHTFDYPVPSLHFLNVINYPNEIGSACNFVTNAIYLEANKSGYYLPPYIKSIYAHNDEVDIINDGQNMDTLLLCEGDYYTLNYDYILGATYIWYKDGVLLSETSNELIVTESGLYELFIENTSVECLNGLAKVSFFKNPEVSNKTLFQCDEDGTYDGKILFNLGEITDDFLEGDDELSVKFYTSEIDAQNETNEIDSNIYSNITNPQIIYVRVDNLYNTECYDIAELTLEVSTTTANDAALFTCDDDGIEDGFYEFDLSQADNTVLGGTPASVTLNYYETYEDALLEQNALPNNYTNSIPFNDTIYARVEDDNACYGINKVQLTVYKLPDIETEFETLFCLNYFPETITLNAGLINGNPIDYTYAWSTGETTYEIDINAPGTYSVTVTNGNGCSKDRTITVLPSNIATIDDIEVVDATANNRITILVSGEGDYEFAIDDINGPYQDSNLFDNVPPGLHTVYIRDKNNCGIVDDIVSVIGFPKFLTPNGDGYHDTWQVYGLNHSSQIESIVYIFDRYGKLIKQLSPTSIGWDGTFNGQPLPSSDYWFHVKLQDGRVFKSHFTLKR